MSSNPNPIKLTAEVARKSVLDKLKALSRESREKLSTIICERTIEALKSVHMGLVALYRPLPSEVNLEILEKYFQEKNTRLCYPRVSGGSVFCHVPKPHLPDSWKKGSLSVHEPTADHEEVEARSIDCIIVPGLAFGLSGERVGRGKGHYDRLLAQTQNSLRVALAFDFQLFEALEQNAWDQPVHWIMTERRELKLRRPTELESIRS
jgi:5-formyltetrahydrofolate cyclo-ligase